MYRKNTSLRIEVVLCSSCARQFYNVKHSTIRRLNPYQVERSECSYCGIRLGWDYVILPSKKVGNNFSNSRKNKAV